MSNVRRKIRFGTDGWRGLIADDFTFANVEKVSRAVARYLKNQSTVEGGLIIGYDARFLAAAFAERVAQTVTAMGIKVYKQKRPLPTPIVAYLIKEKAAAGAVMLTASHNPPNYQGIKFIAAYAGPATNDITKAIEAQIGVGADAGGEAAAAESVDDIDFYWRHLREIVDFTIIKAAGLKVAVDPLYGAAARLLGRKVKEFVAECTVIHNNFDPLFGGREPDPNENNLAELASVVQAGAFDLGVAVDGDGDRFGVIDSLGNYLSPNQVISLLAHYLLAERGWRGALVRTTATTKLIDDIAADFGVPLVETPVGFKWISREMLHRDVVIGGEESGGLSVKGHIPEKDGILAAFLVMEMAAAAGKKPLSQRLDELYRKYGRRYGIRLDIHLQPAAKKALMERLQEAPPSEAAGNRVAEVSLLDGVKLNLANGDWLLIRPSGTEPLVRAYIEAKTTSGFTALESFAQSLIK